MDQAEIAFARAKALDKEHVRTGQLLRMQVQFSLYAYPSQLPHPIYISCFHVMCSNCHCTLHRPTCARAWGSTCARWSC